jgi:hypothetical protein
MNQLRGKGFFIWKIPDCENGDPTAIATTANQAGLSHVLIKIANGIYDFNYDSKSKKDLIAPVAQALKGKGIQVWGWHYIFGDLPLEEAKAAIRQLKKIPLDGYVIDAESEYLNKYTPCRVFLNNLREAFPEIPIALSSFRYPKYHPDLPWRDFFLKSDFNMPQVYWEQAHNPAEQLRRSINEFQNITPFRPVFPTGPAYCASAWCPSPQEINDFMKSAVEMNLDGVNFYSWDYCRNKLPQLWDTIANFPWPGLPIPPKDIAESLMEEINRRNISNIIDLYSSNAVFITSKETIQGITAIRNSYDILLNNTLNGFTFITTAITIKDNTRHISWIANGPNSKVITGNETIGLLNGKIIYHYSTIIKE